MGDDYESRLRRLEHEVDDNVRPKLHDMINLLSGIKATLDLERLKREDAPDAVTWPMLKTVVAAVFGTLGIVATVLTILHLLGKL